MLRGRRIAVPKGDAARPTADRVREALFSTLGPLDDLRVLDLFAGSGALGIEALSRGAARVLFVEQARRHAAVIKTNLTELGLLEDAEVLCRPVERAGKLLQARGPYQLVFADPPYAQLDKAASAIGRLLALSSPALLAPAARLVIEHGQEDAPPQFASLETLRSRRYGGTMLSFYAPHEDGAAS